MNIEKANAISLPEILSKLGYEPTMRKGDDLWYLSPLREEKTASFKINTAKNVWYDFGESCGGDVVNFVKAYLNANNEDDTVADALRWMKNMMLPASRALKVAAAESKQAPVPLKLRKVLALEHKGLINYLRSRGISLGLANRYVDEVIFNNSKSDRDYHAIGLHTVAEGFELRNEFFKGCIGTKSITFIRGTKVPSEEIHVFEGMMDFLSAVAEEPEQKFDGDVIVLNSVICLPQVYPFVKNYSYKTLYSWLDNDVGGIKAMNALKTFASEDGNLEFKAMNKLYAPYKDVNDRYVAKIKLNSTPKKG